MARWSYAAVITAAVLMLPACGGGGGSLPSPGAPYPPAAPSSDQPNLVVSGSITGSGPQLFAHKRTVRDVRTNALSFSKIVVDGTLYTGDAAAYQITNEITMPVPSNGVYTASVPFSNVPVHANQWVVLQFYGQAADGSKISIGDLAGLVNVTGTSTNAATLTVHTTQVYQVFLDLLTGGFVGQWDLNNDPDLGSMLSRDVADAHGVPNPKTQLFDGVERARLYRAIFPHFNRQLTVKTSPIIGGIVTVAPDYTDPGEVDLAANQWAIYLNMFEGYYLSEVPRALGSDIRAQMIGVPSLNPQVAVTLLGYDRFDNTGGTVTINGIYGGHLLVGATTLGTPFFSGLLPVAGRSPGASVVTLPVSQSAVHVAVNDPIGFGFPNAASFYVNANIQRNEPLSNAYLYIIPTGGVSVPNGFSAKNNILTVNTFNPYGLKPADLEICADNSDCAQMNAPQPVRMSRDFYDDGKNLGVFNYSVGGVAQSVAQGIGSYTVTTSGAGKGTLTTLVRSTIYPQQTFTYPSDPIAGGWTVTARDAAGNAYTSTSDGSSLVMSNVLVPIQAVKLTFTFTASGAGSFNWIPRR